MVAPLSSAGVGATGLDARALDALRTTAARDPKAAIREAAKQFETLFMQQLMKSMRASTMQSGMLDNAGTQLGTEMLDTQFTTKMAGLPGGLGDVIARQLERQISAATSAAAAGGRPVAAPLPAAAAAAAAAGVAASATADAPVSQRQTDFLQTHQDDARAAEAESGIPAAFMVAQAAHESGWGRREIRNADGSPSHNLFGIKAGAGWKGAVAEITTTEWVGGEPQKVVAKFRAYSSYAESFQDYARLLKDNPRYAGAVAEATSATPTAQGFAQQLQRAGYATDPAYAGKLTRVINTTLRLQRALG